MNKALRFMANEFAQRLKRRWRDVASTMALDTISLLSLLVTFPLTVRALGPDLYGEYTILYLIFGLVGLWVNAGPTAAIVQLTLQLEYDGHELLRLARRQVYRVGLVGSTLGSAIALALLGRDLTVSIALVLFVDFLIASVANLNTASVLAIDGVVRSARLRMSQPILRVSAIGLLAATGHITIHTLIGVNILASIVLLARSQLVIRRRREAGVEQRRHPTSRELMRYSSLYSTSMSTNAVQNEGEKFVLASVRSPVEVGQYSAAYRVVSMALLPLGAVVAAASRWYMVKDEREGAQLQRTRRLTVPTTLYGIIAAIGIILGRPIIDWVVGSEFDDAGVIAVWLCALPLLHGLADLPPMALLGLGRNRARMFMGMATSLVAIAAYAVLVPLLGWRGAVIGTYISEFTSIIVGWVLLIRCQRVADLALTQSATLDPSRPPARP